MLDGLKLDARSQFWGRVKIQRISGKGGRDRKTITKHVMSIQPTSTADFFLHDLDLEEIILIWLEHLVFFS